MRRCQKVGRTYTLCSSTSRRYPLPCLRKFACPNAQRLAPPPYVVRGEQEIAAAQNMKVGQDVFVPRGLPDGKQVCWVVWDSEEDAESNEEHVESLKEITCFSPPAPQVHMLLLSNWSYKVLTYTHTHTYRYMTRSHIAQP